MPLTELTEPLQARLLRSTLDRELAAGADPRSSAVLACRARQLVSRGFRRRMAGGLRRTIEAAEQPRHWSTTSRVPVQRSAILAERELLLDLARELVDEPRVSPRGMARLEQLLTDGRSPFYYPSPAGALRAALRHTRSTLLLG